MVRELSYIVTFLARLRELFEVKLLTGFMIAAASFLFDPTQYMALYALFFLVIADFLFAIVVAKKTGMTITSAKFARTPFKLVIYFGVIACAHVTEYALPAQMGFLDDTLTGFLAATELLSILEKSGYLGYAMPQYILNQLHHFRDDGQDTVVTDITSK